MDGVAISNPGKVWWPEEGITKLDVVCYYADIAPRLLPWMADRPLAAERCPDGMRGSCFFQKNFAARGAPELPTIPVRAETTGRVVHYVVGGAKRTLLTLVNLGCIPIHLIRTVERRFARGDPWADFWRRRQRLPDLAR